MHKNVFVFIISFANHFQTKKKLLSGKFHLKIEVFISIFHKIKFTWLSDRKHQKTFILFKMFLFLTPKPP